MTGRHRAALLLGLTLAAVSFLPAVITLADRLMLLHVFQEMVLLALVVPLIAYGAGSVPGRYLAFPLQPLIGILALNLSLFGAQLPAVVNLTAHSQVIHATVQLLFMTGAFLFWIPIMRKSGDAGALSPIARIGYLMVASVPPTIPGIVLAFSHHLFYASYRSIEDQQLAGLLLFGTAKFALVTGTFVILWELLSPEPEGSDDDPGGTGEPDGPAPAPAWFARLDESLPGEQARRRERVPSS